MQSELKPCAHCGGEARLWSVIMPFDADCDSITVQCADCDAIGADVLVDQDVHSQSDLAALEVEAIAAWNARASDAEITRLTEALRLQMEAKHKEAAEAKLWFQKAQEWKEALRAAEEREKALQGLVPHFDRLALAVAQFGPHSGFHDWWMDAKEYRQALAGAKP